ncbi:glycosyltransferase [Geodermatophilus sp. SYSU D00710]
MIVLSLANPSGQSHGGEARIRGLTSAIAANGYGVETCEIPQAATGEAASGIWDVVGRLKRQFLPLPLVRRRLVPQTAIQRPPGVVLLSTVPHVTYAMTAHGYSVDWADYFDLPFRFAESEAASRSGLARLSSQVQSRAMAAHHRRATRQSRMSTYAGYGDFKAAGATSRSVWLPPVVEAPTALPRPQLQRRTAGFMANFNYWPNLDALTNLLENWLRPLRRAGFDVVVGGFGAERLSALPSGVRNLGQFEKVEDFYAHVDVVVLPVRRGSGIKVKAMEGLLSGRPVLVDPHVLDGFLPSHAACFEVFTGEPVTWEKMSMRRAAMAGVAEAAAKAFSAQTQKEAIAQLLENLLSRSTGIGPNLQDGADSK